MPSCPAAVKINFIRKNFGGRQLGTEGSEPPRVSGHIPTGVTWPRPISDV